MVLHGEGYGETIVLARAAVVRDQSGRPTLADDLLVESARRMRGGDGPLDVVLVAPDAAPALLLRLPGLSVVGVIAEGPLSAPLPEAIAAVGGVSEARDRIPEGEWVIVDAVRGRVLVAPDAAAIARVQSAPERPRVLLGAAHTPASTQSDRAVAVWAVARSAGDLDAALDAGADGVLIALPSDFVDPDAFSPVAQVQGLLPVIEALGGGPVALFVPADLLDPLAVVNLAARCDAYWLLEPDALPIPVADLRAELSALIAEERDADRPARLPRLVAVLAPDASLPDDLAAFDEALTLPGGAPPDLSGMPLRVWLPDSIETALPPAVARGAVGIVVAPTQAAEAKDLIRIQE